MIKDKYKNFKELELNENKNFNINISNKNKDVTVLAIHGGEIEPITSDIAEMIASVDFNYYIFNGNKPGSDEDLHLTSTHFDDSVCLNMVKNSKITVSIHGSADKESIIYLGGLDIELRNIIEKLLKIEFLEQHKEFCQIINTDKDHKFSGINKHNIVNRNIRNMGVQIELSQGFRKKIVSSLRRDRAYINIKAMYDFSSIITKAIKLYNH
jgi:phage replication-related protein YjqB (UPF0714/DUF867 family)